MTDQHQLHGVPVESDGITCKACGSKYLETVMMREQKSSWDPSTPENRELIENHKANRLANPWVAANFDALKEKPDVAHRYWVEQIGDAELYEQAAKEEAER